MGNQKTVCYQRREMVGSNEIYEAGGGYGGVESDDAPIRWGVAMPSAGQWLEVAKSVASGESLSES